MGCCFYPERFKLTVNSKTDTNGRDKMGQESRWAKGQDGLLSVVYPLNSGTNSEQQEKQMALSKWARVEMGEGSRWAAVV